MYVHRHDTKEALAGDACPHRSLSKKGSGIPGNPKGLLGTKQMKTAVSKEWAPDAHTWNPNRRQEDQEFEVMPC